MLNLVKRKIRKEYKPPWYERYLGEHISVGPITVFGFNAMHVAVNIKTRWGYICFHPSVYYLRRWWRWYFYISRNATPWAATVALGPGVYKSDKLKAKRRRALLRALAGRWWWLRLRK